VICRNEALLIGTVLPMNGKVCTVEGQISCSRRAWRVICHSRGGNKGKSKTLSEEKREDRGDWKKLGIKRGTGGGQRSSQTGGKKEGIFGQ